MPHIPINKPVFVINYYANIQYDNTLSYLLKTHVKPENISNLLKIGKQVGNLDYSSIIICKNYCYLLEIKIRNGKLIYIYDNKIAINDNQIVLNKKDLSKNDSKMAITNDIKFI